VQRQEKVCLTLQPEAPREVPRASGPVPVPGRIVHDIADEMNPPPDTFLAQIAYGVRGWTEKEVREVVDGDAV